MINHTLYARKIYLISIHLLLLTAYLNLHFELAWAGADTSRRDILNSKAGVILCSETGKILFSQNANTEFTPASTLKVLTSLCAWHYLGESYRFKTEFFLDADSNLKIKGYGDPLFTSELIAQACHQVSDVLKSMKISELSDIIVDNTFFSPEIKIDGTTSSNNPYDALVGPTCANFNTVSFTYSQNSQKYISGESQTPLLPFVLERVQSSRLKEGRIVLSEQESQIYVGMLIKHFLSQKEGIRVKGKVTTGLVTKKDLSVYSYISPYDMDAIIMRLLKYSSNFMANQLFLSSGAKAFSPPATVEKGVAAITEYAHNILGISSGVFAEGSGLSRQNRVSPASMIKILGKFKKKYELMQAQSIPNGITEYYKTGTLNGVRTRCGYFKTLNGELYSFVIMINQDGVGHDTIREFLWQKLYDSQSKEQKRAL